MMPACYCCGMLASSQARAASQRRCTAAFSGLVLFHQMLKYLAWYRCVASCATHKWDAVSLWDLSKARQRTHEQTQDAMHCMKISSPVHRTGLQEGKALLRG